jgi:hypothetical protein
MSGKLTHKNPTYVWYVWRAVMLAATIIMGLVLIMAGSIMGASGTGLYGMTVTSAERTVGQLLVVSGVLLLPVAACMFRRTVKPVVVAALLVVGVDLVAFMFVENGSASMFALTYGLVMAIAFKKSRHLIR